MVLRSGNLYKGGRSTLARDAAKTTSWRRQRRPISGARLPLNGPAFPPVMSPRFYCRPSFSATPLASSSPPSFCRCKCPMHAGNDRSKNGGYSGAFHRRLKPWGGSSMQSKRLVSKRIRKKCTGHIKLVLRMAGSFFFFFLRVIVQTKCPHI